jgi:hypothetical protein
MESNPLLPFEFVVIGTPISLQAKNRERLQAWKNFVRQAAEKSWGSLKIRVRIV